MKTPLLEFLLVASVLLVSGALAWFSQRPPRPRVRRTPAVRIFLAALALVSLLLPVLATLMLLLPGASNLLPPLVLLVGVFLIALYLLRAGLRFLRRAVAAMSRIAKLLYTRPGRRTATQSIAHSLNRRMFKRKSIHLFRRHAYATVALVLTAVSIYLTRQISRVGGEDDMTDRLRIAMRSPLTLPRPPVIHLSAESGKPLTADIELRLSPGQSVQFAFSALTAAGCGMGRELADLDIGFSDETVSLRRVTVHYHPSPHSGSKDETFTITCQLDVTPYAETFAERSITVESFGTFFPESDTTPLAEGHIVDFRLAGASDITLQDDSPSPATLTDNERWLPNVGGHIIVAKWHDTKSSEERDVLLVVIGGLLGLAASCLLEWARPHIAPE